MRCVFSLWNFSIVGATTFCACSDNHAIFKSHSARPVKPFFGGMLCLRLHWSATHQFGHLNNSMKKMKLCGKSSAIFLIVMNFSGPHDTEFWQKDNIKGENWMKYICRTRIALHSHFVRLNFSLKLFLPSTLPPLPPHQNFLSVYKPKIVDANNMQKSPLATGKRSNEINCDWVFCELHCHFPWQPLFEVGVLVGLLISSENAIQMPSCRLLDAKQFQEEFLSLIIKIKDK